MPFKMYKIRSMRPDAALVDHASQSTLREDPRVLRIGKFMRRWNIDELLWTEEFIESMNNPEPTTRHDHYEQAIRQFARIALEIPIRV